MAQFPAGSFYDPTNPQWVIVPDGRSGFIRVNGWGQAIDQNGNILPPPQSPYQSQSTPMGPQGGAAILNNPAAGARVQPSDFSEMFGLSGGSDGIFRRPFYPTMPLMFKGGATFVRVYGATVLPSDPDYAVESSLPRPIKFDLPVIACALTGAAFNTADGNALPVGMGPLDVWGVQLLYGTNDTFTTDIRIASTALGTASRPAQIGGNGWMINSGGLMNCIFYPLLDDLRMDVGVWALESRGGSNFTVDGKAMPW